MNTVHNYTGAQTGAVWNEPEQQLFESTGVSKSAFKSRISEIGKTSEILLGYGITLLPCCYVDTYYSCIFEQQIKRRRRKKGLNHIALIDA